MKFLAMLCTDAFFILLGLSMLVGQTFTGQGYVVGALGVAAGVLGLLTDCRSPAVAVNRIPPRT